METIALASMCFILAATIIYLIARNPDAARHMLGIAVIRDQDDIAIRRAVAEACKGLDVRPLNIEQAEHLIEETARHAIGEQLASVNPGRKYEVTRDWPWAKCVISGNIAVVRISLGHDYMNDHDGIRAVNFEIDRGDKVLNLRPWAPKQPELAPIGKPEPRPTQIPNPQGREKRRP